MTDPATQLKAIQESMRVKASLLVAQMNSADVNGRQRQQAAPVDPAEQKIAQLDRLLETATDGEREALMPLRDAALAEAPPGPGDGGARQSLPAPSLQEQADQAAAAGDISAAMSIKSQMLGQIVQRRNEGNQ